MYGKGTSKRPESNRAPYGIMVLVLAAFLLGGSIKLGLDCWKYYGPAIIEKITTQHEHFTPLRWRGRQ